jgi:nucleoside-diphosphate-sugar epimerase
MIIGRGLLANSMAYFEENKEVLIFASGVSNSKEIRECEFHREFDLLCSFLGETKKIVYFSTCGVLYHCSEESLYVKHKRRMEEFIRSNFENYLICRLPNVVGKSENPHTAFNYFKSSIMNGSGITIEKNTTRYFIDVEDVAETLIPIISNTEQNQKEFNVCFKTKIPVVDFVKLMANEMRKEPKIIMAESGCSVDIENEEFLNLVAPKYKNIDSQYNIQIIKKYLR